MSLVWGLMLVSYKSKMKYCVELFYGVFRAGSLMANHAFVNIDFVVITPVVASVAPKVNFIEIVLHKLETEAFVPANWKYIK